MIMKTWVYEKMSYAELVKNRDEASLKYLLEQNVARGCALERTIHELLEDKDKASILYLRQVLGHSFDSVGCCLHKVYDVELIQDLISEGISIRAIEKFPEYEGLDIKIEMYRMPHFGDFKGSIPDQEPSTNLEDRLWKAMQRGDVETIRELAVNPHLEEYIWTFIPHVIEEKKISKQALFTSFIRSREQMRKIRHLEIYKLNDPLGFYMSLPEC